jgi:hypothetical protein
MNKKLLINLYRLSKHMREKLPQRMDWVSEIYKEQYPKTGNFDIQSFLLEYIRQREIDDTF